ncbi:carboxymuconolactone decarboxylase family protein [Nocardioides sp. CPCC 205120]|uniref:carboxymuconolactone decarboxylase family protein n=1 Tax=Nocardioides sp. CPCC 205120 TaxID=3406462 RepID=UPI003B50FD18
MPDGRIRKLVPTEMDPSQKALYDAIVGGPRSSQAALTRVVDDDGALEGPFNAFLQSPPLGHALQAVGASLRYGSGLPDRLREVAILVVAACRDADFERFAHEPVARSLGLGEAELACIRTGDYEGLEVREALVARAVREMVEDGDLADVTFDELRGAVGTAQLFELTTVVGYYSLLALQLRVFRVATPDQAEPGHR